MTRPAWVPAELYPFEDRYVKAAGANVHYVDEGDGPPLLLLHGNPTWSFLYREVIKGLRDRYRCIAVDYPGFGLSTAPGGYGFTPAEHAHVLEQFVASLDLQDVTMMTQDWGGPIGFAVATRHPARFTRFVIGNTWAWPMGGMKARFFSGLLGGPVGSYLIKRHNIFVEKILPAGVKRHALPEEVMNAYRGPFASVSARRAVHVLPREIVQSKEFLQGIERGLVALRDCPALILWPSDDLAFADIHRERWEEAFPSHRTIRLEGAGHFIQEDAAEEIVAAIRDWSLSQGEEISR